MDRWVLAWRQTEHIIQLFLVLLMGGSLRRMIPCIDLCFVNGRGGGTVVVDNNNGQAYNVSIMITKIRVQDEWKDANMLVSLD